MVAYFYKANSCILVCIEACKFVGWGEVQKACGFPSSWSATHFLNRGPKVLVLSILFLDGPDSVL